MQVSKWGNSLAVRLPAAVVDALQLKEGDQIEVRIAGDREFEITRDRTREKAIENRWLQVLLNQSRRWNPIESSISVMSGGCCAVNCSPTSAPTLSS